MCKEWKVYKGSGGKAPCILNRDIKWESGLFTRGGCMEPGAVPDTIRTLAGNQTLRQARSQFTNQRNSNKAVSGLLSWTSFVTVRSFPTKTLHTFLVFLHVKPTVTPYFHLPNHTGDLSQSRSALLCYRVIRNWLGPEAFISALLSNTCTRNIFILATVRIWNLTLFMFFLQIKRPCFTPMKKKWQSSFNTRVSAYM
jgi:hypothetical protein